METIELLALVADSIRRIGDARVLRVSYDNDHNDGEIFVDVFDGVNQTFVIEAKEIDPDDDK